MVATTPLDTRPLAGFASAQQTILHTSDLAIGYAGKPARVVAAGLDLTLHAGELVCLIGPNGVGKSTLMRTLAGMQQPLGGRVTLIGDDAHRLPPAQLARRLSVVLTERINPGMLTASAVVALGRHPYTDWAGRLRPADVQIVENALASVGASPLANRQISELSDGERQKIMIARALAQQPALMLLDEPTAFLDLPRRAEIMQLLRKLAHDEMRAILLSTHDLDLALRTADRIWLMSAGGLQTGAPEDLILSGAFEHAFHAEGVTFDSETGAFKIGGKPGRQISVSGSGLPALWTQRALERAGFALAASSDSFAHVNVEPDRWHLHHADRAETYDSVYDLIEALKRL